MARHFAVDTPDVPGHIHDRSSVVVPPGELRPSLD
jgi:hypothetical protein